MATVVQASFTAADGTDLGSYTPETGGGFALHPSYSKQITITNNRAVRDSIPSLMFATAVPDSADQTVEFLAAKEYGGTSFYQGGCARISTTENTFYCWRLDEYLGFRLFKVIAGTWTQLGSLYSDSLVSGESRTCKLSVVGSTLNGYVGGVLRVGPITDAAITDAGRIGIIMSGTGGRLDDLLGQTVGGGPAPITGYSIVILDPLVGSIAGTLALAGTANQALDPTMSLHAGALTLTVLNATPMADSILSATGVLPLSGQASGTLDPLLVTAAGVVGCLPSITASMQAPLGELMSAAGGSLGLSGQSVAAMAPLAATGAGQLAVTGAASAPLGPVAGQRGAALAIAAASSQILAPFVALYSGVVGTPPITGGLTLPLEPLTVTANGTLAIAGGAVWQVAPFTVTARGVLAPGANEAVPRCTITATLTAPSVGFSFTSSRIDVTLNERGYP